MIVYYKLSCLKIHSVGSHLFSLTTYGIYFTFLVNYNTLDVN